MSGRAIIFLVSGIIIVASIILYRIEAASTNIVSNFRGYYLRQSAQNVAQSGVNLALRQLENDRTWRAGFSQFAMLNGKVSVTLADTTFESVASIVIRSIGTAQESTMTSTAFAYFPPALKPLTVLSLLTINGPNSVNGNITIDGRDHDMSGKIINGKGTYAVWSTSASFSPGGSYALGGTASGVDYAPARPNDPAVLALGQSYPGGFPTTPDSVFGGASKGYSEGTLKSIAQSGVGGSQYATNPGALKYPLSGVTYVELPNGGSWLPANLSGSGVIVVHNSAGNAVVKNSSGTFNGILISDDIVHLHGTINGAIVVLTKTPSGNVVGNGNSQLNYSTATIQSANGFLALEGKMKVIAWWE